MEKEFDIEIKEVLSRVETVKAVLCASQDYAKDCKRKGQM